MNKKVVMPTPIDQRPGDNPYPTDTELRIVRKWDVIKYTIPDLVEYVRCVWWRPERGFRLYKGRETLFRTACMKLELHTCGWSGNESVIGVLQQNFFWFFYWQKSIAGGHYYFEIRMSDWNRNLTKKRNAELITNTNRIMEKQNETS